MLRKTVPLKRYEVRIIRDGKSFQKKKVIALPREQSFLSLGTESMRIDRRFYYEIWNRPNSSPPTSEVPKILFRGTAHDPTGLTVEHPVDLSTADGSHDQDGSDFERRRREAVSVQTFSIIVPRFDGQTLLKLFSEEFRRVFESPIDEPCAEIPLP